MGVKDLFCASLFMSCFVTHKSKTAFATINQVFRHSEFWYVGSDNQKSIENFGNMLIEMDSQQSENFIHIK